MAGGANYGLDKGYLSASALGSAASGPDVATSYDYFVAVVPSGTAGTTVTLATVAGANVLGVSQQRVATADINKQVVDIRLTGITKVVAGGTVAVHDQVQNDTAGKAVTSSTAGDRVFGTALTGGAAGDVIDVLLTPGGQVGAA
jgi:hypothetical protein